MVQTSRFEEDDEYKSFIYFKILKYAFLFWKNFFAEDLIYNIWVSTW